MSQPASHTPYIPASTVLPEMTFRAVIVGTVLGMIFGASSLYLVLKVGLTVSASIPVAVLSMVFFKFLSKFGMRNATILENNISQTAGSAGESIAFGIGVTMPAIMILGFDLEFTRVMLVAVLGGLLGILMMIPVRRALIVQQHGTLKFPEGTACAEVLKAGASEESRAASSPEAKEEAANSASSGINATTIFAGLGIGFLYQTLMQALKGWRDTPEKVFSAPFDSGSISAEISSPLLGVGYVIGPRIASIMCAGGVLAYLVLIPMIKFFGAGMTGVLAPGGMPISAMSPNDIRGAYVLYIGAGAVAAGGIISLCRSLPMIWHGLRAGLKDVGLTQAGTTVLRTDKDLPMSTVFIGSAAMLIAIVLIPSLHMNFFGALLILIFGFLFVTVSSRLTGEVGSSSNPISGMTVATLLFTCLIFLLIGWTGDKWFITALSVGGIVCVASSNGGTTSQDLKTGFLIGATPRLQQISILIGSLASALVLGPILIALNNAHTVYVPIQQVAPAGISVSVATLSPTHESLTGPQSRSDQHEYLVWQKTDETGAPAGKYLVDDTGHAVYLVDPGINGTHTKRPDGSEVEKFPTPKATLMSYIIKGVLGGQLPWNLVLFGAMIAISLEMASIPSLPFAVGLYLPLSSSSPIFVGGIVRWLVDHNMRKKLAHKNLSELQLQAEADRSPGVLLASGYIAGGAIASIIVGMMVGKFDQMDAKLTVWSKANNPFFDGPYANELALIPFAILVVLLWLVGRGSLMKGSAAKNI